jgi:hypothetical protein
MLHGNMNPFDLVRFSSFIQTKAIWFWLMEEFMQFGWVAAVFEWWSTYYLLWPEDGYLRKNDVRAVYDVSLRNIASVLVHGC